ncbi:MAG: cell wall hydrolase [Lachnospiraceae bacterium]|nr:cell wall hydrolase [Lachnospiraceae bacterium]
MMYKKYAAILYMISLFSFFSYMTLDAKEIENVQDEIVKTYGEYLITVSESKQRNITYYRLEKTMLWDITDEDYTTLLKIVEAEAGGEDYTGKLLVANVVLNRVKDESFPDSITEVVYQTSNGRAQFSPVGSGRIEKVTVSEETITAVTDALNGADESEGALYFAARKYADPDKMQWFDEKLLFLFAYGGHEFFTEY